MSFLEEIKKLNEEIRGILPENIVHFCDELVEIQLEAINKTLDSADKHGIDRKHALASFASGLQNYCYFYEFDSCKKTDDENTCKDTECPFYCEKQNCVAKEGCGGYTPEEQDSWKDRMMKHFVKGE